MRIELELPDNFFEDGEQEKFENFFKQFSDMTIEDIMKKIVLSSLSEYKEMFLGRGMPSRADEIREHRLNYLIRYLCVDKIPSEQIVASMFHIPQSRSKNLIRSVLSRFHYENEEKLNKTLLNVLNEKETGTNPNQHKIKIQSSYILEEMNRIVSMIDPSLLSITKVKGSSGTYIIDKKTLTSLEEELTGDS